MSYLKQSNQYKDSNLRQHRAGLTSEVFHQGRHQATSKQTHETAVTLCHQPMFTPVSPLRRIILANQPRLLREMLGHVFATTPGLQVVAEIDDPTHLIAVMDQTDVHWVIVTLNNEDGSPTQAVGLLEIEGAVNASSLTAISPDGKQVEIQTTTIDGDRQTYALYDISLANLLSILS